MTTRAIPDIENRLYFGPNATDNIAFTLTGLPSQSGWISDRWFRGSSLAKNMGFRIKTALASSGTVGQTIDFYVVGSDTYSDGNFSTSDSILPSGDISRNTDSIGGVTVDGSSRLIKSGRLYVSTPYVQIAAFNNTTKSLSSTASDHQFEVFEL